MNVLSLLKVAGGAVLRMVYPKAGDILTRVNAVYEGEPLTDSATGHDVAAAIDTLPNDKRVELLRAQVDAASVVVVEENTTLRTALSAELGHKTRAFAIRIVVTTLAASIFIVLGLWGAALVSGNVLMVAAIADGWPMVLAITGTFSSVLAAYFGRLTKETETKVNAAAGLQSVATGLLGKLLK